MTLALTSLTAVCARTFFFLGQWQQKTSERGGAAMFRQGSRVPSAAYPWWEAGHIGI
jgi:hypothetical protein